MKQGLSLEQFATEIQRQAKVKKDYLAPTKLIQVFGSMESGAPELLTLDTPKNSIAHQFGITDLCHSQLATHVGIDKRYYDRMRGEAPDLWKMNVNHWLHAESKERRVIRTLDGKARAFLSSSYRAIDNVDVAEVILRVARERKLEVVSCDITDRNMYIKAVSPENEQVVKLRQPGTHNAVNEPIRAGFCFRNSEVGCGAFALESFVEVLRCTNGMRGENLLRKFHVGKELGGGDKEAREIFTDETRRVTDKALMLQLRDAINGTLSYSWFGAVVEAISRGSKFKVAEPADMPDVVEEIGSLYALNEDERGSVLNHLMNGGDFTHWGLTQAITRTAQDAPDYERASELERIGFTVLQLPQSEIEALVSSN